MQTQILTKQQLDLLPLLKIFSDNFYLVSGTAIALHLGHRRSIDFDLFSERSFTPINIRKKIQQSYSIEQTFFQGEGELTVLVNQVKMTFFHYPFVIERSEDFDQFIKLPDILSLGAMKIFALGRRAKWKDYVDLYFIFNKYSFQQLIDKTKSIFGNEFNEKLFRSQISYFDDIDYSESINYLPEFEKKDEEIKKFLEKISLE